MTERVYVPGTGNPKAKLMIVGEAPSFEEVREETPFVGPSGQMLWEILGEIGVERGDVWTTNVFKYQPPGNKINRIHEVCNPDEEREKLWNEIRSIQPNCILALGNTAFHTLRGHPGIMKWRGSILNTKDGDIKLVAAIHPANLIREKGATDYSYYPYIWKFISKLDYEKALRVSKDPNFSLPQRYVTICRDSMQLRRFLDDHKHRKRMSADIESLNCIPVCVGIAFDKYEALVIPLFNRIGLLNIGGIPKSDQSFIWQLLDETFKEKEIVGQNFKYDQEKLEMLGFTFNYPNPIKSDTLLKCHTIIPELPSKKMEMQQSIWTDLPYHKDEGKEWHPKKDGIHKLFHYCGLDAISTWETDDSMDDDLKEMSDLHHVDMVSFYYDYVMKLHQVYIDMERIGFRRSQEAVDFLKVKYLTQHDLVQARFVSNLGEGFQAKYISSKGKNKGKELTGKKCHPEHTINTAASDQIKWLIYNYLKLPKRGRFGETSADEDTLVGLLNNVIKDERRRSIVQDIIEDRRIRKTLGTYVLTKPDFDGRIRGSYRITGTETGRSSTSILKPPLRPFKTGHAFQTLTKHGTIGADIRTIYICDEGFVFVQIDLSQAEPRIVAVLSEDYPLLSAFNSGKVDIHRRTAALVLDLMPNLDLSEQFVEVADTIGKDSEERFLGKKSRNGGNYDMGARELATNIATNAKRFGIQGVTVSEWRAGKMLENFHRESPNIRGIFHKEIQEALHSTRTLINPFGRVRTFYERFEKATYGEGYAQIPQSTVADKVKTSILKSRKEMKDINKMLMGEAHDALLFRFPKGEYKDRARLVKGILEEPISFRGCTLKRDIDLVIPADVEYSETNYKELEKLKL